MKAYKIFVIVFVLGVVSFVYATANNAQTTNPTDNKQSCCLKKADGNTESCCANGACCSDENCCKDGECKMNGACCGNGSCCADGACKAKNKADSTEQSKEKGSGGACCKAKHKTK